MSHEPLACAFTGHRAAKLPWGYREDDPACLELKQRLQDAVFALYGEGCRRFYCGMANGCDMYFCEAVLELREERPDATIEAVIPWEGQADRWGDALRRRYDRLVSECDFQTLVQTHYSQDCMMRRNRYMVDHADILLAVYNGKSGGTRSTMLYAMRRGLQIIELPVD